MGSYYVNDERQFGGDFEIHLPSCEYFPSNRTYLGDFDSCFPAVAQANLTHYPANGCSHCCRDCHSG